MSYEEKDPTFEVGDFYSLKYIWGSNMSIVWDKNKYYIPDKSVVLLEKVAYPKSQIWV